MKIMGVGEFFAAIILIGIFVVPAIIRDHTFNNRTTPDGYGTDHDAMFHDLSSGMSKTAVKDKYNRGGYDIKK